MALVFGENMSLGEVNEAHLFCQEPTLGMRALIQKHSHDMFPSLRSHSLRRSQCQLHFNKKVWGHPEEQPTPYQGLTSPLMNLQSGDDSLPQTHEALSHPRSSWNLFTLQKILSPLVMWLTSHSLGLGSSFLSSITDHIIQGGTLFISSGYFFHLFHFISIWLFFNPRLMVINYLYTIYYNLQLSHLSASFICVPFSHSYFLSSPSSSLFPSLDWKVCRVDANLCLKHMHTTKVY